MTNLCPFWAKFDSRRALSPLSPPEHHISTLRASLGTLADNLRAHSIQKQLPYALWTVLRIALPNRQEDCSDVPSSLNITSHPLNTPLNHSKTTQTTMSNRILSIVSILLAASTAVHAIGDFPCSGTTDSQSCAAWSTDKDAQGVISPDAVCQPGERCIERPSWNVGFFR